MHSPNRQTLSKRIVDALPVSDRETVYWDRKLPGFGKSDLIFVSYITVSY